MKMTSVVGDASMFVTGKLTEIIDGDIHSETKQERNEVSEKEMNIQSQEHINKMPKMKFKIILEKNLKLF